jgi:hypothetical protein
MSSAHSPKILRQKLVADVAIGAGGTGPPPPPPIISVTQTPVDVLPRTTNVLTETLTAQRLGDTSQTASLDWAVSAGPAPSVDGTDFALAVNAFPSGTFAFPPGATTATDQFDIAAKAPPTTDENAVFTLRNPVNAKYTGQVNWPFKLLQAVVVVVDPITDIRQDTTKVFWNYVEPPSFSGYEIRTSTILGLGWAKCKVLVASQTTKQVLKSSIPTGVKEVLVKPTIVGGQQAGTPARIDITSVVNKNYPSGLPWLSGLNPERDLSTLGYEMLDAFAVWRGRPVDVVNSKANRPGTWTGLINSLSKPAKDAAYAAAFSRNIRVEQVIPMIPGQPDTRDLNACGNTNVNASEVQFFIQTHTAIANYLASLPKKFPYIIRLGHEMEQNINGYSPTLDNDQVNFSHYNLCMQRACDIYHAIVGGPPNVYIDQCHLRTGMNNVPYSKYFPGAQYVDIVGVDGYCTITDEYAGADTPKIKTVADFNDYMDAMWSTDHPRGPRAHADWSRTHGVKFGMGEWSISSPLKFSQGNIDYVDRHAGGPNDTVGAIYCAGLFDFFLAYQDVLIYECIFNVDDLPKGHLICDYNTTKKVCTDLPYAPAASAAYRNAWKP